MTKQEKHEFYKRMLNLYERFCKSGNQYGFCNLVYELHTKNVDFNTEIFMKQNLPELMTFRPEDYYKVGNSYWFPIRNIKIRIHILQQCIKLTEDEDD